MLCATNISQVFNFSKSRQQDVNLVLKIKKRTLGWEIVMVSEDLQVLSWMFHNLQFRITPEVPCFTKNKVCKRLLKIANNACKSGVPRFTCSLRI